MRDSIRNIATDKLRRGVEPLTVHEWLMRQGCHFSEADALTGCKTTVPTRVRTPILSQILGVDVVKHDDEMTTEPDGETWWDYYQLANGRMCVYRNGVFEDWIQPGLDAGVEVMTVVAEDIKVGDFIFGEEIVKIDVDQKGIIATLGGSEDWVRVLAGASMEIGRKVQKDDDKWNGIIALG